jgi:hypothetical protein
MTWQRIEGEAEYVLRSAGLDDFVRVPVRPAVEAVLGRGALRFVSKRELRGVAELGSDGGRTVIRVAHGLPIAAGRFAAAHELGHAVLDHNARRDEQIEAEADRFVAALLMPWRALHYLRAELGDDLEALAGTFLVTQTAVALRLGEVGEVAASIVVAPGCVRARSLEEIVLPTEEDLRWLARASDDELERVGPGIKKATLTDDPRRVALVVEDEVG